MNYHKTIPAALALAWALSGIADAGEITTAARIMRLGAPDAATAEQAGAAIDAAARSAAERNLLIAVGWHESRFKPAVCSGARTGDGGKAWGCWQSWEGDRSGGVHGQARRAIEHLRRAGNYCKARGHGYYAGAVSLYATGRRCRWRGAPERIRTMARAGR